MLERQPMERNSFVFKFCQIKNSIAIAILLLMALSTDSYGQAEQKHHRYREVLILWKEGKPNGTIEVLNGSLSKIEINGVHGKTRGNQFDFSSSKENRIALTFKSYQVGPGAGTTLVTINTVANPFSFFLRDVNEDFPIYIPEFKVVVLPGGDPRSYDEVTTTIQNKRLETKLQLIEKAPEESFTSVKDRTRNQSVPTWLGISRDIRIFQISQSLEDAPAETDIITPKNSAESLGLPEMDDIAVNYLFISGRGQGVESAISRRLEEGVLPILHSEHIDGEIRYHSIAFATLESRPMNRDAPIGTDFIVADHYSAGHMFTQQQQETVDRKLAEFKKEQSEQTVLYYQIKAENIGKVPRYAWYKTPRPGRGWWDRIEYTFDEATGFSRFSKDRIFCISKLNNNSLPNEEISVLLMPGEIVTFEFCIPHSPISEDRAIRLAARTFETRYQEAKIFWKSKLNDAARIRLPEERIEEMVQAGLLHLDLVSYGKDPDGTLAPMIGIYSPIGTESSPIIQFYCSMGWHDQAKRCLMYFLDKQHDDGMIQNFGEYMVETGAALWSMGEYFRYTDDLNWVEEVRPKLLKACDYLLNWRNSNKNEALKGKGYGMIDGKVADPEDPFHQYMLNGYAYIGLSRVAEMLQSLDPFNAGRLKKEAENWRKDIQTSFYNSMAHSPVVPLGDGTWCPTVSPWTEITGPRSLFVRGEPFFSHGTFTAPDVLLGPMYLVFCEVLDPDHPASRMMLNYSSELFFQNNAAFSQPYYSRHNWYQLKLGLVKAFLKTYYNTFSAMADRETYTFWEHLYHASPHKTHEEAWFLMQTRWMLYMEDADTLHLLPGISRKWLEEGKSIQLKNASCYFGRLSLKVDPQIRDGYIEATIQCDVNEGPGIVTIRLPHPEGRQPVDVEGGVYDRNSESVIIAPFEGEASVRLKF